MCMIYPGTLFLLPINQTAMEWKECLESFSKHFFVLRDVGGKSVLSEPCVDDVNTVKSLDFMF